MVRSVLLLACILYSTIGYTDTLERLTVISVVDGDTLRVERNSRAVLLRLIGIDALETRDNEKAIKQAADRGISMKALNDLGRRASDFVASRIKGGSQVDVEFDKEQFDPYGRLLGYVYQADGVMLNREILRLGYAHLLNIRPNTRYQEDFKNAYDEARFAKRGLWVFVGFAGPEKLTVPRKQPWFRSNNSLSR